MSFLYVEFYEVRQEIPARVQDMANLDLGLRGDSHIELDELEPLKQRTGYVMVGLNGIRLVEVPVRTEITTAIIGVIITYRTDEPPQVAIPRGA